MKVRSGRLGGRTPIFRSSLALLLCGRHASRRRRGAITGSPARGEPGPTGETEGARSAPVIKPYPVEKVIESGTLTYEVDARDRRAGRPRGQAEAALAGHAPLRAAQPRLAWLGPRRPAHLLLSWRCQHGARDPRGLEGAGLREAAARLRPSRLALRADLSARRNICATPSSPNPRAATGRAHSTVPSTRSSTRSAPNSARRPNTAPRSPAWPRAAANCRASSASSASAVPDDQRLAWLTEQLALGLGADASPTS